MCSHVLEHVPDPPRVLARLLECLEPGGHFVGLLPINERKRNAHHESVVDRSTIETWCRAAGGQIAFYLETDPWSDRVQPLFADAPPRYPRLNRAISLTLGLSAAALGPAHWSSAGSVFARLTRSNPTQAVFAIKKP